MINAIGPVGNNIFMPSVNFEGSTLSALQSVTTTSSYTVLSSVDGGLSEEGMAFLALLALQDEDKELNLAQRLLLLGIILKGLSDNTVNMQALYSSTALDISNAVLPVTGYDASGAALSGLAAAPVGSLYSAGV